MAAIDTRRQFALNRCEEKCLMANRLSYRWSSARSLWMTKLGWAAVIVPVAFVLTAAGQDPARAASASEAYVPTLKFDVASIRQSPFADSYTVSASFAPHSSFLRITNFDAMNLLIMAYGVRRDQVSGMPHWDWDAMFNIQAKSDSAADQRLAKLSKDQERLEQQHMMQVLLAERFRLKVHWETRQGPTYNLMVLKGGPKMAEAKDEPETPEEIKIWGDQPIPRLYQQGDGRAGYDFIARGCSIDDIVEMLSEQFARPVFDKTGLSGRYDFTLRYYGARLSDRSADDMNPVPPLDKAIEEQLGLKLEHAKGPAQFLVIDHMERPSDN
jgi:uncharacterized protein (TIGR03435 family)